MTKARHLPRGHKWLLKRMELLDKAYSLKGACYGTVITGAKAFLLDDIATFDLRNQIIFNISELDFKSTIEIAENSHLTFLYLVKTRATEEYENSDQIKLTFSLNEYIQSKIQDAYDFYPIEFMMLLSVRTFFETLVVSHLPEKFPHLFPEGSIPYFQNIQGGILTAPTVFNDESFLDKDLLVKIDDFSGAYHKEDLETFLKLLRSFLIKVINPKQLAAFILRSGTHAVMFGFKVEDQHWYALNSNFMPFLKIGKDEDLANFIRFYLGAYQETIIFTTEILALSINATVISNLIKLCQRDPDWIRIHEVTPAKAKARNLNSCTWLYHAAKFSHLIKMTELLKMGADPHAVIKTETPISVAIKYGNFAVVKLFLEFGCCPIEMKSKYSNVMERNAKHKDDTIDLIEAFELLQNLKMTMHQYQNPYREKAIDKLHQYFNELKTFKEIENVGKIFTTLDGIYISYVSIINQFGSEIDFDIVNLTLEKINNTYHAFVKKDNIKKISQMINLLQSDLKAIPLLKLRQAPTLFSSFVAVENRKTANLQALNRPK